MANSYDEKKRVINCESAAKCGSCAYAGMKYDNELKVKQNYIDKLFKGVCPVDEITGMYRPVHYRNKVHAVVGEDKNGNIITVINQVPLADQVHFEHKPQYYKYKICPVSSISK